MSKLKNIIKQLSEKDYQSIFDNLMDSSADKSAMLLKYLKEKQLNDAKIMVELDVNPNAYYTLRSRLNEKIEEYLVMQMESPKADILKKVASINEIVFTKKRTIVLATLKKLEKELIDFDLSNELTIIYKNLKKYHLNTPEHYHYSQLYNKHVAYTLALDKAEDIIADYFRKYGSYFLNAESHIKTELILLYNEVNNVSRLYQSHRLYIYVNCLNVFHKIFVEPEPAENENDEDGIAATFDKIDQIMETYSSDTNYHHLRLVFDYLKLLYFDFKKLPKKGTKHYKDVNEYASVFISNYSLFTFTPLFLVAKLDRSLKSENPLDVIEENKEIFADIEVDTTDLPKYLIYQLYRTLCFFHADKFDQSSKIINNMLNEVSLKKYPDIQLEIKTLLALQYCLIDDYDLFNQLMNSIQRQIRLMGKKKMEHIVIICKILKVSLSAAGNKTKATKIKILNSKIDYDKIPYFTPFRFISFKDDLLIKLSM